jgi:hypothetical protein
LEAIAGQEPSPLKNKMFLNGIRQRYGLSVVEFCFQGYEEGYGNANLAVLNQGLYLADKRRMDAAAQLGSMAFVSPLGKILDSSK